MVTIVRLSDKPCFLCGSTEDAAEVRFKDRTFAGVVCKEHLFQLMKKHKSKSGAAKHAQTPTKDPPTRTANEVGSS
jgi:hypothetical protein